MEESKIESLVTEKIKRVPTERCWFFGEDGVKRGWIVGAIVNKPDHPYPFTAYHVILEDESKHTIRASWAKKGEYIPKKQLDEQNAEAATKVTIPVKMQAADAKPAAVPKPREFTQRIDINPDLEKQLRQIANAPKDQKRSKANGGKKR